MVVYKKFFCEMRILGGAIVEEITSIIQNSESGLAIKLSVLLLTMCTFAVLTFIVTGFIKIPWELRKGLAVLGSLIGIIVWIEYLYV